MKADWKTVPLGEVCEVLSGFAFKSSDYKNSGHFLIRISNVQDGYLSLSSPKYVQLDDVTARFALNAGDILVSLTGNVGRVAEVTHQALPAALNQRVAKVNPNEKILSKLFLLHFLRLNDFRTMLESQAHGAAQANVSPNVLK
ncbi:MAG: restriction endonuclease subunit S, partial [Parvibaculales bacterium]